MRKRRIILPLNGKGWDIMKYIVGIDQGTQSTKAAIYDLHGKVVCEEKKTLSPLYSPDADTAAPRSVPAPRQQSDPDPVRRCHLHTK